MSLRDLKKRGSFSFLSKKEKLEVQVAKMELTSEKLAEKMRQKTTELANVDEDDGPKIFVSKAHYNMLEEAQARS